MQVQHLHLFDFYFIIISVTKEKNIFRGSSAVEQLAVNINLKTQPPTEM